MHASDKLVLDLPSSGYEWMPKKPNIWRPGMYQKFRTETFDELNDIMTDNNPQTDIKPAAVSTQCAV